MEIPLKNLLRFFPIPLSLGLILVSNVVCPASDNKLDIKWTDPMLSVKAANVSLDSVAQAVAKAAKLKIDCNHYCADLVSFEFSNLPLNEAIRTLLANKNYIVESRPAKAGGGAEMAGIIVLGSATSNASGQSEPTPQLVLPAGSIALEGMPANWQQQVDAPAFPQPAKPEVTTNAQSPTEGMVSSQGVILRPGETMESP